MKTFKEFLQESTNVEKPKDKKKRDKKDTKNENPERPLHHEFGS